MPKSADDLKSHRLLARRFLGGKVLSWGFKNTDGSLSVIDPDPAVITLSAPEALSSAAASGLGIAQVGVHHAYQYLKSGTLKVVLFGLHDPGKYEMVIQYPHRSLIAPRVKVTIDYLLKHFESDESLHIPLEALSMYEYQES